MIAWAAVLQLAVIFGARLRHLRRRRGALWFSLPHPRLVFRIVCAHSLAAVAPRRCVGSAAGRSAFLLLHDKGRAGYRRRDRMAVAAWDSVGLIEPVLQDLAALAAHRLIAVRHGDTFHAALDRGDQFRAVHKFERRGGSIGFGVEREAARRDVETGGGITGDHNRVQAREMAEGCWREVGRHGEGDHVFFTVLHHHQIGGGFVGEQFIPARTRVPPYLSRHDALARERRIIALAQARRGEPKQCRSRLTSTSHFSPNCGKKPSKVSRRTRTAGASRCWTSSTAICGLPASTRSGSGKTAGSGASPRHDPQSADGDATRLWAQSA